MHSADGAESKKGENSSAGRKKERPELEGRVWTAYLDPRTYPRVIDQGCRGVAHKTF